MVLGSIWEKTISHATYLSNAVCLQVYPGQTAAGQYAVAAPGVQGYSVPVEQIPAMNQVPAPLPGQPAPR